jgi:hypothetical protein
VSGQISRDGGASWQPLTVSALLHDAPGTLDTEAATVLDRQDRVTAVSRQALAADAADWLDVRIRFVEPDDPIPHLPEQPSASALERGGCI